jgi:hypothetical protein
MLGAEQGKTAFDDLEFASHPLYTVSPWFMSGTLGWHRLADKLGL